MIKNTTFIQVDINYGINRKHPSVTRSSSPISIEKSVHFNILSQISEHTLGNCHDVMHRYGSFTMLQVKITKKEPVVILHD